jgi:predicted double-glycine peptidase
MYALGDQAKIRKVGFSLLDMKTYLTSQGLHAEGYRWTPVALERATSPAIALIQVGAYRHFVVIKGVRGGMVMVGDPAQGLKLFALPEFARIWNGVVLVPDAKAGPRAAYDRTEEWSHFTLGPMDPLDDTALASFTREMPPIFQVVGFANGGGAIR